MAIYHLTVKTISRGNHSGARARIDYIDRAGKYRHDLAEVMHKESGNMPVWARENPHAYWQAADENERANGRLFRQVEFALPNELNQEQQKNLAREFCISIAQTNSGPLPFSFAIHLGHDRHREPGKRNPHCHLMLSERINDGISRDSATWFKRAAKEPPCGGARKSAELKPGEWLHQVRVLWEKQANTALALAGHEARIDCRSLKAQGIDREPTFHLGPAAAAMEGRGVRTERGKEYQRQNALLSEIGYASKTLKNTPRMSEEQNHVVGHYRGQINENKPIYVENKGILDTGSQQKILTQEKLDKLAEKRLAEISPEHSQNQEKNQEDGFTPKEKGKQKAAEIEAAPLSAERFSEMETYIYRALRNMSGTVGQHMKIGKEALALISSADNPEETFLEIQQGLDLAKEKFRER